MSSTYSYLLSDSAALVGRHMTHLRRTPQKIIAVTLMPIMFVVVFGYLFGSSMQVPQGDYHEYIMAGIFAQMMLSSVINTGVGVAEDLNNGLVERFRSLPMAQISVLIGRTLSDLVLNAISCVAMLPVGFLIGWRLHAGPFEVLAGFLLLLLLGYAMAWLGVLIGLALRHPQAVNSVAMVIVMPLAFLSATFYPLNNLPGWLRTVAEWNPVTTVVTAMRELWGNPTGMGDDPAFPLRYPVSCSLILIAVLLVVVVPLTNRAYRRATAQ
ncbi:ABC transporter permease [Streptomyces poonensis]|uniref:Transport permease protein n=1 Tax=Streptomyces poonensis TaxID=68255 RepID=A0A918PYS8_9ACTN|nr:ABC transporter permease [Streptomyces poonensis]GGZ25525.1 transport permease protein [Streptomyces poonensis]GLJ89115.1 transport permease protein [Streptomyces poonensis]